MQLFSIFSDKQNTRYALSNDEVSNFLYACTLFPKHKVDTVILPYGEGHSNR